VTILKAIRAEERKLVKRLSKLQGARVFPTFRFDMASMAGRLSCRSGTMPRQDPSTDA
jgi:hypothetical protein